MFNDEYNAELLRVEEGGAVDPGKLREIADFMSDRMSLPDMSPATVDTITRHRIYLYRLADADATMYPLLLRQIRGLIQQARRPTRLVVLIDSASRFAPGWSLEHEFWREFTDPVTCEQETMVQVRALFPESLGFTCRPFAVMGVLTEVYVVTKGGVGGMRCSVQWEYS